MTSPFRRSLGLDLADFLRLPVRDRARLAGQAIPDLHTALDDGRPLQERSAPASSLALARDLGSALLAGRTSGPEEQAELEARLVTDALLREQCAHDQNVYLGPFYTRRLTRAVPELLFLPRSTDELRRSLLWARRRGVPITLRGAASTAMGGAVPADAGLAIDMAHLDEIDVEPSGKRVVFGCGARLRAVHRVLAEAGFALPVYPSNLGGTYVGWFATGGIGLNAYRGGRALEHVIWAELVLPNGELVRLHADTAFEVFEDEGWRALDKAARAGWFTERGTEPIELADLAGSEGQLGAIVNLAVATEPLPDLAPWLLSFETRAQAVEAIAWLEERVAAGLGAPSDLKLLSASHVEHVRSVWALEEDNTWRARPGAFSGDAGLPWRAVHAPTDAEPAHGKAGAFVFVNFSSQEAGAAFAAELPGCPGKPGVSAQDSVHLARDRFRPQEIKRLGPGLLAAEIDIPAAHVAEFLPTAERLARQAGNELDAEVYYLADGNALVLAAFLVDHRKGAFMAELLLAPALLDLAMARFEAKPYVIGRWQATLHTRKLGPHAAQRLRTIKQAIDPDRIVNRGAFFDMGLQGVFGALVTSTMGVSLRILRHVVSYAPWTGSVVRAFMNRRRGIAAGRGLAAGELSAGDKPDAHALHCINCGECNSVCPIFHEAGIRLPQVLTHLGESAHANEDIGASGSTLLDLCMRCGNCEEVCQAGIPHLPLFADMQTQSNRERPYDRERHVLLLERVRGSQRYTDRFLDIRAGGYEARAAAALPGSARFLLLRSENESGPAASCLHCAACVDVCPTQANREFEGEDPRWITTEQDRCIGCGTCVEVCPANLANGGQTLRVMEAPASKWFDAVSEFKERETTR